VLLLSAKAGGVGFNVVGANRLVLFDPDWNPAVDRQVIGRVYREGQKKPVFVYRLLSTGSIEEKIFQRQAHKQGLSNALVDEGSLDVGKGIALELLRDLFSYSPTTASDTHDQLGCQCADGGEAMNVEADTQAGGAKRGLGMHQLRKWDHLQQLDATVDSVLVTLAEQHPGTAARVSFIFSNSNGPRSADEKDGDDAAGEDAEEPAPAPTPALAVTPAAQSAAQPAPQLQAEDDDLLDLED
jgi:hypothetical protein